MLTLRAPPGVDLEVGKGWLRHRIGHLGQTLKRDGFDHIGLTVFERNPGDEHIHAHHVLHVPRGALHLIERFVDGDAVVLTRAHLHTPGYITKQRQQLAPDYERSLQPGTLFNRKPGDIIPGPRLHVTSALKALMPDAARPPRRRRPADAYTTTKSTPPVAIHPRAMSAAPVEFLEAPSRAEQPIFLEATTEAVQLPLPIVAPVIDIFAAAEAKRKDLGLSQREAADHLGIRQSHWSNSIVRHHDTLSSWAINRVRDFLADRLAA